MKIIRINTEDREYNGNIYKYYTIYALSEGKKVLVGCPASTPIQVVDKDGLPVLEIIKLGKFDLRVGDNIEVWYQDNSARVAQIDVVHAQEAQEDMPL